jgi:hypothetical protein
MRPEFDPGAGARLRSPLVKVFWFFFSKKNYFLSVGRAPPPASGHGADRSAVNQRAQFFFAFLPGVALKVLH